MKEFITLEQFLLLTDPYDGEFPRSIFNGCKLNDNDYVGQDFVNRYYIAKKSWERYGDNGPPVGSIVVVLESGHSCSVGGKKTFDGICDSDDRFFTLSTVARETKSLVEKTQWWAHICPSDMIEWVRRGIRSIEELDLYR